MELRGKPGGNFQDRIASVMSGRNGRGRYVVEIPVGLRREWSDAGTFCDVAESYFQGYEFPSEADIDRFIRAQPCSPSRSIWRFETEAEARAWLADAT